jgi:hypothetical protein
MPMHEVVHSIRFSKLLSALRLPSLAGDGLPERMRSISFALLGLTAAAGLALVALFAQPGSPLLSPAPLPDQPSADQSIAAARSLALDHRLASLVPAGPASPHRESSPSDVRTDSGDSPSRSGGGDQSEFLPGEVGAPAPVGSPEDSGENLGGGGSDRGGSAGGNSTPAPTGAPQQAPTSSPAPDSSPQPASPSLNVITSSPKPEATPAPGNSSSTAAAEHASERGIEASASSAPAASSGPTVSSVTPEASPSPGSGNGLAKGHDK